MVTLAAFPWADLAGFAPGRSSSEDFPDNLRHQPASDVDTGRYRAFTNMEYYAADDYFEGFKRYPELMESYENKVHSEYQEPDKQQVRGGKDLPLEYAVPARAGFGAHHRDFGGGEARTTRLSCANLSGLPSERRKPRGWTYRGPDLSAVKRVIPEESSRIFCVGDKVSGP